MHKAVSWILALVLVGCGQIPRDQTSEAKSTQAVEPPPTMVVHKTETCSCCTAWVEHVRDAGFVVEVRNETDLNEVKKRLGVPFGKGSCHTAEIAGYYIEGHVPSSDIARLLAERPHAKGLVLAGMPIGSPGMEAPDGSREPYVVEIVDAAGSVAPYAMH